MLSSVLLSGLLMISGQNIDFPQIWKKIEGDWSYVGSVKEKSQILMWIEKKTKNVVGGGRYLALRRVQRIGTQVAGHRRQVAREDRVSNKIALAGLPISSVLRNAKLVGTSNK